MSLKYQMALRQNSSRRFDKQKSWVAKSYSVKANYLN